MRVRLDTAQDITIKLTEEEVQALLKGPTDSFHEMHNSSEQPDENGSYYILLRGICHELEACVFLGYSKDNIFQNALSLDVYGRIIMPELVGCPWRINLSELGIEHFRRGWSHGIRYDGEHKLFIFGSK